jgi:hypothetical protein
MATPQRSPIRTHSQFKNGSWISGCMEPHVGWEILFWLLPIFNFGILYCQIKHPVMTKDISKKTTMPNLVHFTFILLVWWSCPRLDRLEMTWKLVAPLTVFILGILIVLNQIDFLIKYSLACEDKLVRGWKNVWLTQQWLMSFQKKTWHWNRSVLHQAYSSL